MEYPSSRFRGTMRGAMKPDIEEAVDDGMDEQEGESEEARLGQTVDVPAEAVEQVESLNSFFVPSYSWNCLVRWLVTFFEFLPHLTHTNLM